MCALDDIGQAAWSRLPRSPMSGGKVNYLEPQGDPGFFGPGSMAWRVHANPIALAVGGFQREHQGDEHADAAHRGHHQHDGAPVRDPPPAGLLVASVHVARP